MPWYHALDRGFGIEKRGSFRCLIEGTRMQFELGRSNLLPGVPVFFIRHGRWTRRMYGGRTDRLGDLDESRRFRFFAHAAASLIEKGVLPADLVHCNDHHTALLPMLLKEQMARQRPKTLLLIHNAFFQGSFRPGTGPTRYRDDPTGPLPPFHSTRTRFIISLPRGILAADQVVTVSPTYARELATPGHSDGLAAYLRRRRKTWTGLINGIDYQTHDPATDPALAANYDVKRLSLRGSNKAELQRRLGLPVDSRVPLLTFVGRLSRQKGVLRIIRLLDELSKLKVQVAISGNGVPEFARVLKGVAKLRPELLSYRAFEPEQESLYYAGGDLFLMPSIWEPCGLSQLKAMRYGCVPVVHATGGLVDTVADHDPVRRAGTGFTFAEDDDWAFYAAIVRGLEARARPAEWRLLQQRAMRQDFSWDRAARGYERLYDQLLGPSPAPGRDV